MKKILFLTLLLFFSFWNTFAKDKECNFWSYFKEVIEKTDVCEKILNYDSNKELKSLYIYDSNFERINLDLNFDFDNNDLKYILANVKEFRDWKTFIFVSLNWEKKFELEVENNDDFMLPATYSYFFNTWNHIFTFLTKYEALSDIKNPENYGFYIDWVQIINSIDYPYNIIKNDLLKKLFILEKNDFNQKLSFLEKEKIDLSLKKYFEKTKNNTKEENEKILKSFEKYLDYLLSKKELKDFSDSEIKEILVFHYIYSELFIKNLLEK